ncbi:cytochrome P450 [Sarocladium strictum]
MAKFQTIITEDPPLAHLAAAAIVAIVTYRTLRAIYRLYLHPLSKFPGPRSAALSRKWVAKTVSSGFPEKEYEKLHKEFGTTALRIAPNQLHISDSSLYRVIYNQSNPFPKEKAFYETFESQHTIFSETDTHLHKQRRKLLNPLFSKAGVNKLEPLILEKLEETKAKVERISKVGPIDVSAAFRCMTVDIISQFSFGNSIGLINEHPTGFESGYLKALALASGAPFLRYYSDMQKLVAKCIPLSVAANFDSVLSELQNMVGMIFASYDQYSRGDGKSMYPVMFDVLKSLPIDQQKAEAINTFIAGSDTTALTLTTALFHILQLPEVEKTLVDCLDEEFQKAETIPSLLQLEQLKYLRACVNEALRVGMPVPGVLPRIVPQRAQPFIVDGKVVPPGTIVGISAYTMHTEPHIWGKDAKSFNPARWLGPNAKELETNMVSFGKGARACIGINISYAEIFITLAHLFHYYKMELKSKELHATDKFTLEVEESGLWVDFKLRQ